MSLTRYVCTHCSRKFEAEEKEILECPGCFWSTSVKKEEDVLRSSSQEDAPGPSKKASTFKIPKIPVGAILGVFAVLLLAVLLIQFAGPIAKKISNHNFEKDSGIRLTSPVLNDHDQAPPKPGPAFPASAVSTPAQASSSPKFSLSGIFSKGDKDKSSSPTPVIPPSAVLNAGLSAEEQSILQRRIQLSAERNPNPEEEAVLKQRANFKTGFIEKLPSQSWTLEKFKEMIAAQEKLYKVPLPRSYKGKLENLFKQKYLPAVEAFNGGDIVKARDLWVESLAFPIYAGNVQKHRGVVLTMLRAFINDTIAKIGTINSSLVEKTLRDKEQAATAAYENFLSVIEARKWQEASAASADLLERVNSLANPARVSGAPAQYPQAIAQLDQDIQATLVQLLSVPPPAIADLDPIRQDVMAKKRVIDSFLPQALEIRMRAYNEALDAIDRGEWAAAEQKLRQVDAPIELVRDAQDKINILRKLKQPPSPQGVQR